MRSLKKTLTREKERERGCKL